MLRGEISAFDQHVSGAFRNAGMFAAHDATDIVHHRVIGDDGHAAVQRICLAVEREHLLAVLRLTGD